MDILPYHHPALEDAVKRLWFEPGEQNIVNLDREAFCPLPVEALALVCALVSTGHLERLPAESF